MNRKIVGIDIGGTKISIVLASPAGKVLDREKIATGVNAETRASLRKMSAAVQAILERNRVGKSQLAGIGIGMPGPVDAHKGIVPWSPNLPGWAGIPLKRLMQKRFGVPVCMDNDANAAAYGEKIFGAGRKCRDFIYMTVSTGIGGGLVLGGRIHRGASFCGGEVGHIPVVPGGNRCNCGKRGCLEAYASGTAIARMAKALLAKGKKTRLRRMVRRADEITAETVARGAELRDPLCAEVLREAGRYLGIGLATLINILNPQMVVLGGSVMKSKVYLWNAMMTSVKKEAWPIALKACRIRKTMLKENVGNLGAAALVLETRQ